MELLDQHTKRIMEGCKKRAKDAGLTFQDESLEYIVTNRDMIELSPKIMIPTLYDYWVHDVKVLKEKGSYELYPHNPFETVINTRPAISYFNDNNPDWMNVMIFYHVLGHIDFFQNNVFFNHTWDDDFTGQALSDKRMLARLRSEKGRAVDYVIEFARGIDNTVCYYDLLEKRDGISNNLLSDKLNYYFDVFLQDVKKLKTSEYIEEIKIFNQCVEENKDLGEEIFISKINKKYPEYDAIYEKNLLNKPLPYKNLLDFILRRSSYLNTEENKWMKSVIEVVKKTSLYFQPQIRTKIMNEGWASYWHEKLFMLDDRISGHEVEFARLNSSVTSIPKVGLNPYALGLRMFNYIEEFVDAGKYSWDFMRILDRTKRDKFDSGDMGGNEFIFFLRENLNDFSFVNTFINQEFVSQHKLYVVDRKINKERMVWEYFVKSKKAEDYKNMIINTLYHPPFIYVDKEKTDDHTLHLIHQFEDKPLVSDYISNTMLGIEYLWGGPVILETHEVASKKQIKGKGFILDSGSSYKEIKNEQEIKWNKVLYTMKDRKLTKKKIT